MPAAYSITYLFRHHLRAEPATRSPLVLCDGWGHLPCLPFSCHRFLFPRPFTAVSVPGGLHHTRLLCYHHAGGVTAFLTPAPLQVLGLPDYRRNFTTCLPPACIFLVCFHLYSANSLDSGILPLLDFRWSWVTWSFLGSIPLPADLGHHHSAKKGLLAPAAFCYRRCQVGCAISAVRVDAAWVLEPAVCLGQSCAATCRFPGFWVMGFLPGYLNTCRCLPAACCISPRCLLGLGLLRFTCHWDACACCHLRLPAPGMRADAGATTSYHHSWGSGCHSTTDRLDLGFLPFWEGLWR